jgi:prephenate dehydratase
MGFGVRDPRHIDTFQTVFDAAYQGAPGAYSEQAAHQLLGATASLLPRRSLEQVFDAVVAGGARRAVVPVENTLSGTVPNVYELLLSYDLRVIGEINIHLDHVLVGTASMQLADVRRVLSHPVALAQCTDFFRKHRNIQAIPVFDTAGAVEIVMREEDGYTAAIAARRAAEIYHGVVLAEKMQDHPENWTRFLMLTRAADADIAQNANRALVAFDLHHEPGSLVKALQPLGELAVNLTKIESRPIPGQPFEYRFVVELSSAEDDGSMVRAVERMQQATPWLRVLGSYHVVPSKG